MSFIIDFYTFRFSFELLITEYANLISQKYENKRNKN